MAIVTYLMAKSFEKPMVLLPDVVLARFQHGHALYNAKAGKLALAGPFMQDPADWRGLYVFAVEEIEEAKALVATDPVIVHGEMLAEYHPWYGSAANMLVPEWHDRLVPPAKP